MAFVVADRIKETTITQGTGTYTLAGAVSGFQSFSAIGNANTTYYCCTDGTDFEVGIGTYTASGTTLERTTILQSSNDSPNTNAKVDWGSGTREIFCTQPADKAVFLDDNGNLDFENTATRIKLESNAGNSGSGDPSISIAGGGPNYIRFHDGTDFSSTTNGVDIVYRTGPNDLLIERSTNGNKMAEFGGDDGHAKLLHGGNDRLETTSDGVKVIASATTAPSLTFGAAAGQIFKNENSELAVGLSNASPYPLYMQGRTNADAGRNISLQPLGGSVGIGLTNPSTLFHVDGDTTLDGDVTFTGDNYNVVWDKSDDALEFADNAKASFGADGDLIMFHSGTASVIRDTAATAARPLYLQSNNTTHGVIATKVNAAEKMARFIPDGACELYHNDSLKFNTTTNGTYTTGIHSVEHTTGFGAVEVGGATGAHIDLKSPNSDDFDFRLIHTASSGLSQIQADDLHLQSVTGAENYITAALNGAVLLYYDNVDTFSTAADGVTVKATGENSARLTLQSDDASPVDWDYEGIIDFKADDDGGTPVNYARISGRTPDVSAGTFDSYLYFHTMEDGTLAETMFLTPGGQLGLNKTNPKFTFYRPGGTLYAIDLQPPTTLRNNRTQRLPDGSGTLMLNRGDGELENTVENFQQHYISGSYFTAGEYLEIASISPAGDSRNYNISGKIMAQISNNAQLLDINVGIRFNNTGSFGATILYNSSQMNTDHVEPVLWTNTSTDNIKLLIKAKTGSIQNLGVDLTLIQRAGYNDTTWNTTETPSDVTSVPSGYTEYTGEKAIGSVVNGAVELYHNNAKKLETSATGVTVTGLLSATTKSFDIPHPTQDGMRLRYGSLEGPENGVYVRGRLTGSSVIELPEHWAGLVHEDSITVQLTPIGSKQDLWVEDVSIERVQVCNANEDCFYMVMAERKDVDKLEVEYAAEV